MSSSADGDSNKKKGGGGGFSVPIAFAAGLLLAAGAYVALQPAPHAGGPGGGAPPGAPSERGRGPPTDPGAERYGLDAMMKAWDELKAFESDVANRVPRPMGPQDHAPRTDLSPKLGKAVAEGLKYYMINSPSILAGNILGGQTSLARETATLFGLRAGSPSTTQEFIDTYAPKAVGAVCHSWEKLGADFNAFFDPAAGAATLFLMSETGAECGGMDAKEFGKQVFAKNDDVFKVDKVGYMATAMRHAGALSKHYYLDKMEESAVKVGLGTNMMDALEGNIELPVDDKGVQAKPEDIWVPMFMIFLDDLFSILQFTPAGTEDLLPFLSNDEKDQVARIFTLVLRSVASQKAGTFDAGFVAKTVYCANRLDLVAKLKGDKGGGEAFFKDLGVVMQQVLDNQNSDGSFGNKNMWLERLYNEDGSENFGAKESMYGMMRLDTINSVAAVFHTSGQDPTDGLKSNRKKAKAKKPRSPKKDKKKAQKGKKSEKKKSKEEEEEEEAARVFDI